MTKTVNLSVHRNTVEKRRVRTLAKELRAHAENMIRECDVRAYALVCIDAKGDCYAQWDSGGILPLIALPATVSEVLHRSIGEAAVKDDWKPNLNPRLDQ